MQQRVQVWKCLTPGCKNELNDLNYKGGRKANYCPTCRHTLNIERNRRNNIKQRLTTRYRMQHRRSYLKRRAIPRLNRKLMKAYKEIQALDQILEPIPLNVQGERI